MLNFNESIIGWLSDNAPLGVFTTDTDLVIRNWNKWLEVHSGRGAEEMIGSSLLDSFPEVRERRLDSFYQDALKGQTHVLAYRFHKYLIALPTSSPRQAAKMHQTARIVPLTDGSRVIGTITSIEDVTERVIREDELWMAREEAEKANSEKDRLLASLSHDLRTPLSSILSWIRLIRKGNLDPARMQSGLKSIESNATTQFQLLEQLLDITRIQTGKLELNFQEVDLIEMIEAAITAIWPMSEARGINIEKTMPGERRLSMFDDKRIQQIVWNLLSNALKFTPQGGTIKVSLEYMENVAELKVADTGVGFSPDAVEHIFKPLWQGENALGHGGLGLGLSIVGHLVELHRGTIRAESPGPGKGATFTVTLPI
jgi:PAS domain S-box-containing protein